MLFRVKWLLSLILLLFALHSCVQHKQVRTGFGGGFGSSESDVKFATKAHEELSQVRTSDSDDPVSSAAESSDVTAVIPLKNHSVISEKKQSAVKTWLHKKVEKKWQHRTRYKPAGDGGGAAVLVLLIVVGLILWGLVKLAGVSLGQILLILGIVLAIVLVFTLLFALLNYFGS